MPKSPTRVRWELLFWFFLSSGHLVLIYQNSNGSRLFWIVAYLAYGATYANRLRLSLIQITAYAVIWWAAVVGSLLFSLLPRYRGSNLEQLDQAWRRAMTRRHRPVE